MLPAGVAAPSQSRYVTPTHAKPFLQIQFCPAMWLNIDSYQDSPPGGAAPGRRNLNGSVTRTVVIVGKRTKHAMRRESSPDSRRGILTGSRFTMTILRSRKKPRSTSESGESRGASLAGGMYADAAVALNGSCLRIRHIFAVTVVSQ